MENLFVDEPGPQDLADWVALRTQLWPEAGAEEQYRECRALLEAPHEIAFLAWEGETAIGFIEGSLRGTPGNPYGHVEGWFVAPPWRHKRVGAYLMGALEEWLLHHHIEWMHSDTTDEYPLSPKAHERAGFEEVGVIRIFRKKLAAR